MKPDPLLRRIVELVLAHEHRQITDREMHQQIVLALATYQK